MQVAIVSDSHYAVDKLKKLMSHLEKIGVTHLIHAGDFITSGIERVFSEYPGVKSYIARGNCDSWGDTLSYIQNLPNVMLDDILKFQIEGIKFIVSHIPGVALGALGSNEADIVIHGHTHQPRVEKLKDALVLNPGSLMDGDGFIILDIPSLKVDRRFRID